MSLSCPEIQLRRQSAVKMLEPENVRLGQITHVNVVADAGAVRRWIIVAINFQYTTFAVNRLERCRNQMSLRVVNLADLSTFISPGSVEITKAHETQSVSAVVGFKGIFKSQFGNPVGVNWQAWRLFSDGYFCGVPIDRAGGGENKLSYFGIQH